jgi:23S rRNA pseudouridine2605 synthase
VVTALGARADRRTDVLAVDGVPIALPEETRTILLHKPAGYLTTRMDPRARDTVMALVPDIPGLHPIGRLDKDTTGLLLLTNDGALTYALTHPKHHVRKTYRAWVQGIITPEAVARLREGVLLEDGMTAPADVSRLAVRGERSLVELTIHEGRKRQVRRMLEAVGMPVVSLKRISVGPLQLGDLPEGQWRELSQAETDALFRAAGVARA